MMMELDDELQNDEAPEAAETETHDLIDRSYAEELFEDLNPSQEEVERDSRRAEDRQIRAAEDLARYGNAIEGAEEHLLLALDSPSLDVKRRVVFALGRIGEVTDTTVERLAELLNHEDKLIRAEVAETLGRLGAQGESAAEELAARLLHDSEAVVRRWAARSYTLVVSDRKALVDLFLPILSGDEEDTDVLREVIEALGTATGDCESVIARLTAIAEDKAHCLRRDAEDALHHLGVDLVEESDEENPEMISEDEDSYEDDSEEHDEVYDDEVEAEEMIAPAVEPEAPAKEVVVEAPVAAKTPAAVTQKAAARKPAPRTKK